MSDLTEKNIRVFVEFSLKPESTMEKALAVFTQLTDLTRQQEAGCLDYQWYSSADQNVFFQLQTFQNSSAYLDHYLNIGPHLQNLFKIADITRWEILGNLSDTARDILSTVATNMNLSFNCYQPLIGFTNTEL